MSGYKSTEYEAGTRVPFIIKEPGVVSNMSNPKVIKAFAYVEDITPTFLDYAGIKQPGSSYNGHAVHPIMGKSLKGLFNGTADRIYGENDIVADEMFNNSAVYMGGWKAVRHVPPVGDGKWQLIDVVNDPTETTNVAE